MMTYLQHRNVNVTETYLKAQGVKPATWIIFVPLVCWYDASMTICMHHR